MAEVGYVAFEEDQKEMAKWDEELVPRKANRLFQKVATPVKKPAKKKITKKK
jgi:hypothetical protein